MFCYAVISSQDAGAFTVHIQQLALLILRQRVADVYPEAVKTATMMEYSWDHKSDNRRSEAFTYQGKTIEDIKDTSSSLHVSFNPNSIPQAIRKTQSLKQFGKPNLSSNSEEPVLKRPLSSVGAGNPTSPSTWVVLTDLFLRNNRHHEALHHPFHRHANHLCPVSKDCWARCQRSSRWWARNHPSWRPGFGHDIVRTWLLVWKRLRLLPEKKGRPMLEKLRPGRGVVLASGRQRQRTMADVRLW